MSFVILILLNILYIKATYDKKSNLYTSVIRSISQSQKRKIKPKKVPYNFENLKPQNKEIQLLYFNLPRELITYPKKRYEKRFNLTMNEKMFNISTLINVLDLYMGEMEQILINLENEGDGLNLTGGEEEKEEEDSIDTDYPEVQVITETPQRGLSVQERHQFSKNVLHSGQLQSNIGKSANESEKDFEDWYQTLEKKRLRLVNEGTDEESEGNNDFNLEPEHHLIDIEQSESDSRVFFDLRDHYFPKRPIELQNLNIKRLFDMLGEISALFTTTDLHEKTEVLDNICMVHHFLTVKIQTSRKNKEIYRNQLDVILKLFDIISIVLKFNQDDDGESIIPVITKTFEITQGGNEESRRGTLVAEDSKYTLKKLDYSNETITASRFIMKCDSIPSNKETFEHFEFLKFYILRNLEALLRGGNFDTFWLTRLNILPLLPISSSKYSKDILTNDLRRNIELSHSTLTDTMGLYGLEYISHLPYFIKGVYSQKFSGEMTHVKKRFLVSDTISTYELTKFYPRFLQKIVKLFDDSKLLAEGTAQSFNIRMENRDGNYTPISFGKNKGFKKFIKDILPNFFKVFPSGKVLCAVLSIEKQFTRHIDEYARYNALFSIIYYIFALGEKIGGVGYRDILESDLHVDIIADQLKLKTVNGYQYFEMEDSEIWPGSFLSWLFPENNRLLEEENFLMIEESKEKLLTSNVKRRFSLNFADLGRNDYSFCQKIYGDGFTTNVPVDEFDWNIYLRHVVNDVIMDDRDWYGEQRQHDLYSIFDKY